MNVVRCVDGMNQRYYFCSNPDCPNGLHVRAGDRGIEGDGNWAELSSGVIIGRVIVQGAYLCDGCTRALIAGAVKLTIVPPAPRPAHAASPVQQALIFTET
jgi:hypothetical protein